MTQFSQHLQADIERLEASIYSDSIGVVDVEGVVHHEFADGGHGRKYDCDKILTDSDLYVQMTGVYARAIRETYEDRLPDAIAGMAKGANRFAITIAPLLGSGVVSLTTEKTGPKSVRLDEVSRVLAETNNFEFVLEIDDVGTSGSTTSSMLEELNDLGIGRIEVFHYAQRRKVLPYLERLLVPYHTLTLITLPTYTQHDCQTRPDGYCATGVPLLAHH